MTIKLRAIDRWQQLEDGEAIPLPGKRRTVEVEFNVDKPATFYVMQERQQTLLRALQPFECPAKVTFDVEGDCSIVADAESEVWWRSDDGVILSYTVMTESFTKLEQRMEMTAEMEITILRANIRQEQRRREVAELLLLKKQREDAGAAKADPETGEIEDDSGEEPVDAAAGAAGEGAVAGNSAVPKP